MGLFVSLRRHLMGLLFIIIPNHVIIFPFFPLELTPHTEDSVNGLGSVVVKGVASDLAGEETASP